VDVRIVVVRHNDTEQQVEQQKDHIAAARAAQLV